MRWSWHIGSIAGIGINMHATFLILLAYIGLIGYQSGGTAGAIAGVVFIIAVFAIVVLHELGHALTARRFGVPTRDITLLPIGGVARLERMPREPRQELLIAVAGPLVNVVLAALCLAALAASGGTHDTFALLATASPSLSARGFVAQLLEANVILVLFNLIPAFPMDGGRVLRALIAMRTGDYPRATEVAARIGRFFALVFGLVGLFVVNNPFLVFIALFVWLGAAGEAAAVRTTATLDGITTGHVMITDLRTLAPHDRLAHAIQLILGGFQQDFPVVDRGAVVGVLPRATLFAALAERGDAALVGDVMLRHFLMATPEEPVEQSLARLKECHCQALPVVRGDQLVGLLTLDNVGEFVMVQSALRGNRTAPASISI